MTDAECYIAIYGELILTVPHYLSKGITISETRNYIIYKNPIKGV